MNIKRAFIRLLSMLTLAAVFTALLPAALSEQEKIICQAEDGVLLGKARIVKSGLTTYVDGLENDGDGVEVTMSVPADGFYDLLVKVKCGTYKENYVDIDGVRVGVIAGTAPLFMDVKLERLYLEKGGHTIRVTKFWGWTCIDQFALVPSAEIPPETFEIAPVLTDKNASENAKRLMSWLTDVYGKKIITGQYSDKGMYGNENQAIFNATGKYPALLGLDLIDYTPSRVERGTRGVSVEKAIEYWEAGGIVTLAWHWNAPEEYITGTWYSAFYTEHTNIDLKKIMNGEDEAGMKLLLRDIDAIAAELMRLQDAGVPILWRPLHEASGGWFWWGAKGADAYISLYRLVYDRLVNYHGLHNLIWVWNGQDASWYPGDEYVDMIGWDIYAGEHAYSSQSATFLEAMRVTDKKMMIILSENGTVPDIDLIFRDGTVWGSYNTWSGDFVIASAASETVSEKYTEIEILQKMYADERAITREDLPDLKAYPID